MQNTYPLRIAILGYGGRAELFGELALKRPEKVKVVCVADPDPGRRKRAAEMFGKECILLERGEDFYAQNIPVDGVWVISQEKTHAQLGIPALQRNLPMIIEKPLATSLRDAYQICDAYDQHPVPLTVPHSLRYLSSYKKVKEIVDSGVLGRIMHIRAMEQVPDEHTVVYYRRGPGMFRSNTVFLLAKCSHDIDIINWIMSGTRVRSVCSFGGADYFIPRKDVPDHCSDACPEAKTCPFYIAPHNSQVAQADGDTLAVVQGARCAWNSKAEQVDHQTLILQFENGTTADFTLNCFGDNCRPLQVTGSLGTVYATPETVKLIQYHPESVKEFGKDELPAQYGSHGGGDDALVEDWIEAVVTDRATQSATVHESAEAVAVCVAAEVSMLEHRIVEMQSLRDARPGPEVLLRGLREVDK